MKILLAPFALGLAALAASPAAADPCRAISDGGALPGWLKPGAPVTGSVRYIGDGDSLCVGASSDPARWVEIRLADFNARELREPGGYEARRALTAMAMGQQVVCHGRRTSYDRLVAICRLHGVSLGDRLRRAGVPEGGN